MKIAVLGCDGFVGSGLCEHLSMSHNVRGISKASYSEHQKESFDVFINANGNSRRYWANENVMEDLMASTVSAYKTFFDFKFGSYIYLSSADVYGEGAEFDSRGEEENISTKRLCPYGFHKYLSELIVKRYSEKYLILRCSALVGKGLKKGPVKDILENSPLFITPDSQLQFISTEGLAETINELLSRNIHNETFNVGGVGTVSIKRVIEEAAQHNVSFRENAKRQVYGSNVEKLQKVVNVKSSEEYVVDFLKGQRTRKV